MDFNIETLNFDDIHNIDQRVEKADAALLIIDYPTAHSVQYYLNALRSLRIPYMFVKQNTTFAPQRILLPVTNLMEDREKAPFAASFARHFHTDIQIIQPNDYGHAAQQNIDVFTHLFDSFDIKYQISKGKKNSQKIEHEALKFSSNSTDELLIISASRDYGLDDIIFGPKERKTIQQATMPTLVINPRADLYPLCD